MLAFLTAGHASRWSSTKAETRSRCRIHWACMKVLALGNSPAQPPALGAGASRRPPIARKGNGPPSAILLFTREAISSMLAKSTIRYLPLGSLFLGEL